MHEKDENGVWKQIMTTPGFIGKNGLGKEAEGDGKTPIGTFSFNCAFGIAEDPGCAIEYHQVNEDDYWSGDQHKGFHYNEMVSIKDLPDLNTEDSEHLVDYPYQYQYCLNISYNEKGKAGLGSAIFLHCFGPLKPYTGGCVAIPKDQMLTVMQNVRPDCVVVIDSLENISPETWNDWGLGTAAGPRIEYGESALFSEEDMDEAIALIREEFDDWEGCELHSIRYAGDDCCSEENLEWLNCLRDGDELTECIEFLSDFRSPVEGGGAWEPDTEYTGWQWWLGREDGGDWELLSWGF
jgi:L,D-peptidoglycan transpeptidase YkuD (ErfK/YbiS/YcfS/YnhG family)